jgi:hypothetical protein
MITSSAHATATAVGSATWSDISQENTVHNGCTCFSPSLTASPCSLDTSGTACPPHWCTRTSAPETPTSRPSYYQTELVVSVDTVKRHVSHPLSKFGAANRVQAVARARQLGLLPKRVP